MPETRAISERINLAYVKRKHWPQTAMFKLSLLVGGGVLLGALVLEAGQRTGAFAGDRFFNSGAVTHAHSMFGNNCTACHVADPTNPQKVAFNMPVQDDKCLGCHETHAAAHYSDLPKYNGKLRKVKGLADPIHLSANCAECHVEHQGYDYNLNRVSDGVCTQCHEDMATKGYAAGKVPPKGPGVANVTSFGSAEGHPDWALFRSKAEDQADFNFGHKKHNDPAAFPRMQEALKAIKDGKTPAAKPTRRARHIEERDGGKLGMSCTFCHEVDSDGAYMKPISFETHCADCHTGNLGVVGAGGDTIKVLSSDIGSGSAKKLVRPQAIPHGSSTQVAELVDKAIAQFVAEDPPQFKPADPSKPAAEGDKPAEESGGGRRRRGGSGGGEEAKPADAKPADAKPAEGAQPEGGGNSRRRGGGSIEAATPAAPTAKLPPLADKAALQAWVSERRVEALGKLQEGANCGMCHTNIKPGPDNAKELFSISDRSIPETWLKKSHFGHQAHAMVRCTECHTGALAGEKTSDVMLPGIANCRQCHAQKATPSGSAAPFDCNLCHTFHKRLPSSIEGGKSIDQVRQGGIAAMFSAPSPQAAPAAPAKDDAPKPADGPAKEPSPH